MSPFQYYSLHCACFALPHFLPVPCPGLYCMPPCTSVGTSCTALVVIGPHCMLISVWSGQWSEFQQVWVVLLWASLLIAQLVCCIFFTSSMMSSICFFCENYRVFLAPYYKLSYEHDWSVFTREYCLEQYLSHVFMPHWNIGLFYLIYSSVYLHCVCTLWEKMVNRFSIHFA